MAFGFCGVAECVFRCVLFAYRYTDCSFFIIDFQSNRHAIGQTATRFQFRCRDKWIEIHFESGNTYAGGGTGVALHGVAGDCVHSSEQTFPLFGDLSAYRCSDEYCAKLPQQNI